MAKKDTLLILGAGGHGKVIADIALKMNQWKHIKFLDDNEKVKSVLGVDVVGATEEANKYITNADIFVAIGDNRIREDVQERLIAQGASMPVLMHSSAVIGQDVEILSGSVVMANVVISPSVRIGKGCIINTGTIVDHDSILMDYVHLSPGVSLAGNVKVGKGTWLGIGSTVINNTYITQECTIGAGAVVVKNISEPGTYIGIPAKRIMNK